MPEKYKPAGSNVEYTVPTLDDLADGPVAFRDFADSIPKSLAPAVAVSTHAASYTLALADNGSLVSMDTSAGDLTVTLPANSPTFLAPVGSVFVVANAGKVRGKKVTIVAASGVTLRDSAVRVVELFRMVSLIQVEKDSWIINAGTGGAPAPGIPSAPKLNTAVAGPASIIVGWDKPVDDGGSPLTGYTVETSKDAGKTWAIGGAFGPTILTGTLSGLTPATAYQVRVKAGNTNGFGDPSNILTATPTTPFNSATGGTETTYQKDGRFYRVHTFSSNSNLQVNTSIFPFAVLCVGRGGIGGDGIRDFQPDGPLHGGGGGGGGAVVENKNVTLSVGTIPVIIGSPTSLGAVNAAGGGNGGSGNGENYGHNGGTSGNGNGGGTQTITGYGGAGGGGAGGVGVDQSGGAPAYSDVSGTNSAYGAGGSGGGSGGPLPEGKGGSGGPGYVIVSYEIAPIKDNSGEVVADKYSADPFLDVARITRVGSLVVNVEIANQEWVDNNTEDPYFFFVASPDKDNDPAIIGLHYNISAGLFEVPAKPDVE